MCENNDKCYKCMYLDRYYTMGVKHYNKTPFGWCSKKRDNVDVRIGCDEYALKKTTLRSKNLISYCLNGLLTELTEIRKIVEEEFDAPNKD